MTVDLPEWNIWVAALISLYLLIWIAGNGK